MILKVSEFGVSLGSADSVAGHAEEYYYVKISRVPKGVSTSQVILLFAYTVKKVAEKDGRYEFEFQKLCPTVTHSRG